MMPEFNPTREKTCSKCGAKGTRSYRSGRSEGLSAGRRDPAIEANSVQTEVDERGGSHVLAPQPRRHRPRGVSRFICQCGYANCADLNAANNIAKRLPPETVPAAAG